MPPRTLRVRLARAASRRVRMANLQVLAVPALPHMYRLVRVRGYQYRVSDRAKRGLKQGRRAPMVQGMASEP